MKPTNFIAKKLFGGLCAALLSISVAHAQIFVTNTTGNAIDEYNLNGTLEQSNFITGLDAPTFIVSGGSNLFVYNSGNGSFGEYSTSGTPVYSTPIFGAPELNVTGIAASGSEWVVWYNNGSNMIIQPTNELLTGLVGPPPPGYVSTGNGTAYGAAANVSTPLNLQYTGIAAVGNSVFTAVNNTSTGVGGIGIMSATAGVLFAFDANSLTVNGLNAPSLLAVSGSNLFVYQGNNTISQYDTSGNPLSTPLLTLANETTATGLAATGTDLFTLESNGNILDTSLTSETSTTLISGLSSPGGIAVEAEAVPEPSAYALVVGGLLILSTWRYRSRRASFS